MARSGSFFQQIPPRLSGTGALPTRDAAGEPFIRLQTLGAATILVGETRLSMSAGTLFSLLLRLAYTPGMMLSREHALSALWPDQPAARQRGNLRQALYKLRSHGVRMAMVGDVIQLDPQQVLPTFSMVRSFEYFERDVTHGTEPFGVFLPSFAVPWPEYQEWVTSLRDQIHADVRRVLVEQLRMRRERADWGGADALARWLLQFDPLNEEATLTVAECTALTGSKREALAIIDAYLAEIGPEAGDLRLQASLLRRRISEMGARPRSNRSPTEQFFVGRDDELADLAMALRRARWREGGAMLVHGPPGIGKSRLVREVEKLASLEGVQVIHTVCRERDAERPFSIFLDATSELLATPGVIGAAPESLSLLRGFQTDPSDLSLSALHSDLELSSKHSTETTRPGVTSAMIEPAPLAPHVRRAVVDVLLAISDESPLMFVVDDAQWMDESSSRIVTELVAKISNARIFVLIVSRDRQFAMERHLPDARFRNVISLAPLTGEKSILLAREIASQCSAEFSQELGEWFSRASEGSPLFLTALVLYWIESGQAGGVPPSLTRTFECRLEALSGDARRLLQAIVLFGKWCTIERAVRVLELDSNSALSAIDELSAVGAFAHWARNEILVHDLLALYVLESMPEVAKSFLSLRIARSLEMDEVETRFNAAPEIVDHYIGAGQTHEARRYALEVGGTSRALVSVYAKLAAFDRLFLRESKLRGDQALAKSFRSVLYESGQWTRLLRELSTEELPTEFAKSWDVQHAERVVGMIQVAQSSIFLGDYVELCNRGLLLVRSQATPAELRFRGCVGLVKLAASGIPERIAQQAFECGIGVAKHLDDALVRTASISMYHHTSQGNHKLAQSFARAYLDSIVIDPDNRKFVERGDCGYAFFISGDFKAATAIFESILVEAESVGDLGRIVVMRYHLGMMAIAEDRFEDALDGGVSAVRVANEGADVYMKVIALRHLARVRLLMGDVHGASADLAVAETLFAEPLHPQWSSFTNAMRLGIAVAHGQQDAIVPLLARCEADNLDLRRTIGQDFAVSQILRAYRSVGRTSDAIEFLAQYRTHYRRDGYTLPNYVMSF